MSARLDLSALRMYERVTNSKLARERHSRAAVRSVMLRDLFDQLGKMVDDHLRLGSSAIRERRPWITGSEEARLFDGLCVTSRKMTRDARLIDEFADEVRQIWDDNLFELFVEFVDSVVGGERDLPLGLEQCVIDWALSVPEGLR